MKDKITPTPWKIVDTPNDADFVADVLGKNLIGIAGIYAGSECSSADSSAIVSAINNTYGIGLDPSMIPSMMADLKVIVDTGHGVTKDAIITLVKYVIQKSKL